MCETRETSTINKSNINLYKEIATKQIEQQIFVKLQIALPYCIVFSKIFQEIEREPLSDILSTVFLLIQHFLIESFHIIDVRIQNDNSQSDTENGLDIENDDDYQLIDDMDHDPNDMNRPRKIRR